MQCAQCDSRAVEMVESQGGVKAGSFSETYECGGCGARGTIHGEAADSPADWSRQGRLFERF